MSALIELRGVGRSYGSPPTVALSDVDLTVAEGELAGIVGPSGSGKSTLLNIMGTLDRPSTGSVRLDGREVVELDDAALSGLRAHTIGFVFQRFHLIEGRAAIESVAGGLLYAGVPRAERRARSREALERVGLGHRVHHRPDQLSGGERQRVAIARAIVGQPKLLLADEPTGSLDSASGATVLELIRGLHRDGTTVVVITHDPGIAAQMDRRIEIHDGRLRSDSGAVLSPAVA